MAEVGDDLLDGELEETGFGELDGEEEDALLADDDYESYQNSRQYSNSSQPGVGGHSEVYRIVDQVQDVAEGDEIIEDGEEDVLELGVVDELEESELDNGQANNQMWRDMSSRSVEADLNRKDPSIGVPTSTSNLGALTGESDEEESEDRGSRFKTERTNVISLKGVSSGSSLKDIPDSLDKVKTAVPTTVRPRGGMQQRGKGSVRGRLGPIQRGPGMMMMRRGFPMRRPNMMQPPRPQLHPRHKIHVNPHFRGGMNQQPQGVWNNERLPPPPGCETFPPPHQEGGWGDAPPHHMGMRPPFPPGMPPPQLQTPQQMYHPPQQPQVYEEQYRPTMESPPQNTPNRIVQFSENRQLITVENQHFQRPPYDQNFPPVNNQFQPPQNVPPQFNNNGFPNQFGNSAPRPNFQPQQFPAPNVHQGYPPQEFHQPQNPPQFQNYNNQNNWNQPHQPMDQQPSMYQQPGPPHTPPRFLSPQQPSPQFRPPFNNNQNQFRPQQQNFQRGGARGTGMKRLPQRQAPNQSPIPAKQARFEHNKMKTPPTNIRSNLQEIKTVDNLPDTTTTQEPEPEVEEDEETKQYRLKIAEQKALREKVLREKEARRLASIIEKKKKEGQITSIDQSTVAPPQQPTPKPQPKVQPPKPTLQPSQPGPQPPQPRPQPPQPRLQNKPLVAQSVRGRNNSANRVVRRQKQLQRTYNQSPVVGTPIVQIQQMLGTTYKIVKVRTKEGAIVTRKTPLVMDETNNTAIPMRTVSTASVPQKRIVLSPPGQPRPAVRMANNMGRGGSIMRPGRGRAAMIPPMAQGGQIRMVSAKNEQGRTLCTVKTIPQACMPKPAQRVVVDKRPAAVKVAAAPALPVSTLVTIDNLSLSTSQGYIQKMAKQAGSLTSFKHEPELKRATLKFQKTTEAEQFYHKFHRKMVDLSRICVTIVPE